MERFVARSRVRRGDWLWAAPFLLPGLLMCGVGLWAGLAWLDVRDEPGRVGRGFGMLPLVFFGFGVPFALAGLTNLGRVSKVIVDPRAGRVVHAKGRPFLPKRRATLDLAQVGGVTLTRSDEHVTTARGPLGKSKAYERRWEVRPGGREPIYDDWDERRARRLAEKLAAAAGVPLVEQLEGGDTTRLPEDLDRPLVERLAAGELPYAPPAAAVAGLERRAESGAFGYRGRRFRLRLDARGFVLSVGPLGLGLPRRLRLSELEQVQVDRRLVSKGQGLRGRRKDERDVLRLVSDRRVLELPLESAEQAEWLQARLLADLRTYTAAVPHPHRS